MGRKRYYVVLNEEEHEISIEDERGTVIISTPLQYYDMEQNQTRRELLDIPANQIQWQRIHEMVAATWN